MMANDQDKSWYSAFLAVFLGAVVTLFLSPAAVVAETKIAPLSASEPFAPLSGPRARVIYVNDLSGDPDGFFATVHQILTPTARLRGIIGSDAGGKGETAARSTVLAKEIVSLMGREKQIEVFEGAANRIAEAGKPVPSAGTDFIIKEAMRSDTKLPLYIAVGAGLTEVASAVMREPKIASRITLLWIGGDALPNGGTGETNFNIDPLAAQFLYNETAVEIWQVPRAVYKTCLVSATEIQAYIAPHGEVGMWLYDRLADLTRRFGLGFNAGETWTLGDNPVVLLSALHDWNPVMTREGIQYGKTGSSSYDEVTAPFLNEDGTFSPRKDGRTIRIYNSIDTRMLFSDFFAKMRVNYP